MSSLPLAGKRPKQTYDQWLHGVWGRVDKNPDSCWLWRGRINAQGYGRLNNRHVGESLAHRIVWTITRFGIPDGLQVLHKCDVPACVRPDHLSLGTQSDNNKDAVQKGRNPKGESHYAAKLTEADIDTIRQWRSDGAKLEYIATKFGVSKGTILDVATRKTWKHVP